MDRNLFRQLNSLVLITLFGLTAGAAHAADLYVATSGDNSNDGTWAGAFTTLQAAIDAASPDDTIYLKGETFTLTGPNPSTGLLYWGAGKNGLTIEGGYAGTGPAPGALTNSPTILQNTATANRNTNRVMYVSFVTNGVLRNLTIQGGHTGNTNPQAIGGSWYGAGIYMTDCENMLLDGVIFNSNRNSGQQSQGTYGAGMYALNSSGVITNSVFKNNRAYGLWTTHYGIGLNLSGGAWTVRDSIIRDNMPISNGSYPTYPRGAGIYINNGTHTIRNCAITRNAAVGNFSSIRGEALTVEGAAAAVTAENLTVYWHPSRGVERTGGSLTLRDSIIWDNGDDIVGTITLLHNNIEDGDAVGVDGNISTDPAFERGLYLASDSLCVDAGSRSVGDAGLTGYTTRADGAPDTGTVNLGYHFMQGVTDYYVSVNDGDDDNAGTSPGSAFESITRALAAAADGSHIHVAAGNYTPATETFPMTVANRYGVQILGTNTASTVLALSGVTSSRGVIFNFAYPDARLSGLSITNAYFYAGTAAGAGVYLANSRVTVDSCNISHNRAHTDSSAGGGWGTVAAAGLYGTLSDGVISNCVFHANRAYATYSHSYSGGGGGVHLSGNWEMVDSAITSNEFSLGTAGGTRLVDGGGLYLNGTIALRNCLIADNWARRSDSSSAYEQGDGVYIWGGTVSIESCTIVDNRGEGIRQAARSLPAVPATVTLRNTILWGNGDDIWEANAATFTKAFNNIEDGDGVGVDGNMQEAPLFVDAGTGNYRLDIGSTSVNAGTNQTWMAAPATDLDGNPRIDNDIVDMGAYEQITPLRIVNRPTANVTAVDADFNGTLESMGPHASAHIYVHWGPENKTTNWNEWAYTTYLGSVSEKGHLSTNITFPGGSVTYFYTYAASNALDVAWAQPSELVLLEQITVAATTPDAAELGSVPGVFTVSRSDEATNVALTVSFDLAGTAENGVDYALIDPLTVTIPVGETNATVTVTPLIDRWIEGDETVIFSITPGSYVIGSPGSATVTIADWVPPTHMYVTEGATGTYATNWASAFTSIQAALDNANAGDTIYVAGGTYTLSSAIAWNGTGVTIRGGYEGTGSPGAQGDDTPTVLTQTGENRIFTLNGVTNGAIENITITGGLLGHPTPGQLGYDFDTLGAGVYMANCSNVVLNALLVHNNTVYVNNSDAAKGGGIYALDSWGTITNCLIRANLATRGSGTTTRGAGVCIEGGGWDIVDTTIRDHVIPAVAWNNTCQGVGLSLVSGEHTVRNSLITRNLSSGSGTLQGGGVYVGSGEATFANCTIYWNSTHGLFRNTATVTVRDSILWANGDDVSGTVTLLHNNIGDGDAIGVDGNISIDPAFERGFYLTSDSLCVDAGSRSVGDAGLTGYTTRADGAPDTGTVDLGYHAAGGSVDYYVDAVNGLDANTGLNPGAAFKTITKALSVVVDGSHVHVAAGLYDLANGETFPLSVANKYGIQILGAGRLDTIIDAHNANQRCLGMTYVYPDAQISGLTLKRGRLTAGSSRGGGLYLAHVQGLVTDCDITDNELPNPNGWGGPGGGGMAAVQCSVTVSNAVIARNTITPWYPDHAYGGGVHFNNNDGTLTHSTIVSNTANASGDNSWATHAYGGGLYINGNTTVRNSLFAHNDARTTSYSTPHGDAAHVAGGTVLFENCTVVTNHPTAHARRTVGPESIGIERAGGTVTVNNSILWANGMDVLGTMTVNWSNVGQADGATLIDSISADPLFRDAPAGDYRLQVKGGLSPSVNTGNPTPQAWMLAGVDLDGNDRILNDRVDQGAYENLVPPPGSLILLR